MGLVVLQGSAKDFEDGCEKCVALGIVLQFITVASEDIRRYLVAGGIPLYVVWGSNVHVYYTDILFVKLRGGVSTRSLDSQ